MMIRIANFFRHIGRYGVLIIGFTMVSIAIFTGAINYGITIDNILRNLPDAIPWFLLLVTLYIAWDYELIGGLVLLVLGLGGIFYMQASNHSTMPQFTIMLAITIFAISFILSWAFRQIGEVRYV
jgi:vacuolar-type H+-ATPase subunit I/STV1